MANKLFQHTRTIGTTANLRSLGANLSDGFLTIGLVKTTDTGQIDWATVNLTATQGALQGYEIWRFNDAAQSTTPIFIKVYYYASNGSSPQNLQLRFEIGSATNGSGSINGYGNLGIGISPGDGIPGSSATPSYTFMSGDGSGIAILYMIDDGTPAVSSLFVLDRFRSSSGAASTDGFVFTSKLRSWYNLNSYYIFDTLNSHKPYYNYGRGCALLPTPLLAGTTNSVGGTNYFSPYYAMIPNGNGLYYQKMLMCYAMADYGFNSNQSISHLGSFRTYKTVGNQMGYVDSKNQAYSAPAIWWSD